MLDVVLRFVIGLTGLCISALASQSGMTEALRTWYPTLNRPPGVPPRWAFPVAWNLIYLGMALSYAFLKDSTQRSRLSLLWWLQPPLMWLWTTLFFGHRAFKPGAGVIIVMILTGAMFVRDAWRSDATRSAALLLPYPIWLCYALYLNLGYATLNQ